MLAEIVLNIRYYVDPVTSLPHIYGHDVSEEEVEQVMARSEEDRPGKEGSRVAVGRTFSGRPLRVIYIPDPEPESIFVVTSYELRGKPLAAFRRRTRSRK
jgi:hypothetical protein